MATQRIYVDTSVFGGCYEKEFAQDSNRLLDLAMTGRFRLLVSSMVLLELMAGPPAVGSLVTSLLRHGVAEEEPISAAAISLGRAYQDEGTSAPRIGKIPCMWPWQPP